MKKIYSIIIVVILLASLGFSYLAYNKVNGGNAQQDSLSKIQKTKIMKV